MSLLMQLILNRDNEVNNTAFSEPFETNMILYRPQRSEEDSDKWQRGECGAVHETPLSDFDTVA